MTQLLVVKKFMYPVTLGTLFMGVIVCCYQGKLAPADQGPDDDSMRLMNQPRHESGSLPGAGKSESFVVLSSMGVAHSQLKCVKSGD